MYIHIDQHQGMPIYEQIVRQVKFAVAAGLVQPSETIPSIRELAQQLAINPNTVIRAYRDLQNDGILATVRGTGLAVTVEAPALCRASRRDLIVERVRSVLFEAQQSGLAAKELREIIEAALRNPIASPVTQAIPPSVPETKP